MARSDGDTVLGALVRFAFSCVKIVSAKGSSLRLLCGPKFPLVRSSLLCRATKGIMQEFSCKGLGLLMKSY